MKEIKLNIEKQWNGVQNTLKGKIELKNALVDAKRTFKKDKEKIALIKKEKAKIDKDIEVLLQSSRELEDKFDNFSRRMGYMRLKNCVLSEALYDNMIAYEEFIKNECYIDDNEVINDIKQAITLLKKLPFECGDSDNDRFREVYNAIADAYIERQNDILQGIFDQVMIELERDEESKIRK